MDPERAGVDSQTQDLLSAVETWREDRPHKHRAGSTALTQVGHRGKMSCKLGREERLNRLGDDHPAPKKKTKQRCTELATSSFLLSNKTGKQAAIFIDSRLKCEEFPP